MRIYVNGMAVEWTGTMIDYGAVLALAKQPEGASVIYEGPRRGDTQRSGTLYPAKGAIAVEDGMHFSAVRTNNA
jgi:hypothetical protein